MSSSSKLQIKLTSEEIILSSKFDVEKRDIRLKWDTKENFSILMENNFQLNLIDLQEIEVLISNDKFLLTPKEYYSNLFISQFLEKAIGKKNSENCEIHHQEIEKEDSVLSFFIPSSWKDFLAIKFPLSSFNYKHFIGEQLIQTSKFLRNQMHVWLENQLAYVILRKNGQLQIANVYTYQNPLELAYFLHSIRETFDMVWTNDTFSIQGEQLINSAFVNELISLAIPIKLSHEQA